MKEEHKLLCLEVLNTLERLNPNDYVFFPVPAIDTLDDDNSNTSKSKYKELVKEPRDLGMIRLSFAYKLLLMPSSMTIFVDAIDEESNNRSHDCSPGHFFKNHLVYEPEIM
jgi:hypothetical protein